MPPRTKKQDEAPTKDFVYPEIQVQICQGPDALTADAWKSLLGWEEQPEGADWKDQYLLKDETGKKVRCNNNSQNRPFTESWARSIAQEVLTRNFAPDGPNGETVTIDRMGQVKSGQHRGIGLILATQIWAGDQKDHWRKLWPTEPTMETIVVFGISESERTTMTLDNVRPRSLSDCLYTSGTIVKATKGGDKRELCRMLEYATRMLWDRTLARDDAHAPRCTHAEATDFIARHNKLVDSVKHVYEENGGRGKAGDKIRKYLSLGYASALHYMMSASSTSEVQAAKYRKAEHPSEKLLDFGMKDKADEFWTMVANVDPDLKHLRSTFDTEASLAERMGWLIKAWGLWSSGGAVTPKNLSLVYKEVDGTKKLMEHPTLKGIDFHRTSKKAEDEDEDEDEDDAGENTNEKPAGQGQPQPKTKGGKKQPTPAEVEATKAKVKAAIKATTAKNREDGGTPKPKSKSSVETANESYDSPQTLEPVSNDEQQPATAE